MTINEEDMFLDDFYDEYTALAVLLSEGYCFLNVVDLSKAFPEYYGKPTYTTCVYVLCSDTFYYSCADAEPITNDDGEGDSEIISLYKMTRESKYGMVKWVSLKRKMLPLPIIVERMKEDDYWDEDLQKLEGKYMKNKKLTKDWSQSLTTNELWLYGDSGKSSTDISKEEPLIEIVKSKLDSYYDEVTGGGVNFFTENDIQAILIKLSEKYDHISSEYLQDITPYDVLNEISNVIRNGE